MSDKPFTKENLDMYLKELAKEFRKRNGKAITSDNVNEIIEVLRKRKNCK